MKRKLIKLVTQEDDLLTIDDVPWIRISAKWDGIINRIPFGWCFYNKIISLKTSTKSLIQKTLHGVSDEECAELNYEISKFALKRLLKFKKLGGYCAPTFSKKELSGKLSSEKWDEILDEMIFAFDYVCHPLKYNKIPGIASGEGSNTPEAWDIYFKKELDLETRQQKGLKLFAKYFNSLWV